MVIKMIAISVYGVLASDNEGVRSVRSGTGWEEEGKGRGMKGKKVGG